MKATYVQRGHTIRYQNAGSAIAAGDIVPLDTRIGIASSDIPAGGEGSVTVEGVFEIKKKASEAITAGANVYYNTTDGITTTQGSDIPAGWAVEAATAESLTARIKIG